MYGFLSVLVIAVTASIFKYKEIWPFYVKKIYDFDAQEMQLEINRFYDRCDKNYYKEFNLKDFYNKNFYYNFPDKIIDFINYINCVLIEQRFCQIDISDKYKIFGFSLEEFILLKFDILKGGEEGLFYFTFYVQDKELYEKALSCEIKDEFEIFYAKQFYLIFAKFDNKNKKFIFGKNNFFKLFKYSV